MLLIRVLLNQMEEKVLQNNCALFYITQKSFEGMFNVAISSSYRHYLCASHMGNIIISSGGE